MRSDGDDRAAAEARTDLLVGLFFLAVAAVFGGTALGYRLGSLMRMGPGYFPLIVAAAIGCIGLIMIVRTLALHGLPPLRPGLRLRPLTMILLAAAVFGLLVDRAGLVLSVYATVLVARLASGAGSVLGALALATLVAALSSLIFVAGLGLPIEIWF